MKFNFNKKHYQNHEINKLNFINMVPAVLEKSHREEFQEDYIELLTFNSKGICQMFGTSWRVRMFDSCRYKSLS